MITSEADNVESSSKMPAVKVISYGSTDDKSNRTVSADAVSVFATSGLDWYYASTDVSHWSYWL